MTQEEKQKIKEEILKSELYQSAKTAFMNGCIRCYDLEAMAHYMFIQGYIYGKTGEKIKEEF